MKKVLPFLQGFKGRVALTKKLNDTNSFLTHDDVSNLILRFKSARNVFALNDDVDIISKLLTKVLNHQTPITTQTSQVLRYLFSEVSSQQKSSNHSSDKEKQLKQALLEALLENQNSFMQLDAKQISYIRVVLILSLELCNTVEMKDLLNAHLFPLFEKLVDLFIVTQNNEGDLFIGPTIDTLNDEQKDRELSAFCTIFGLLHHGRIRSQTFVIDCFNELFKTGSPLFFNQKEALFYLLSRGKLCGIEKELFQFLEKAESLDRKETSVGFLASDYDDSLVPKAFKKILMPLWPRINFSTLNRIGRRYYWNYYYII